MAYNKAFNPDALPAHAEPEQAAQMLSAQRRPSPHSQSSHQSSQPSSPAPSGRRPSPAALAAQQSYRPQQGYAQQQVAPRYTQADNYHRVNSPPPPAGYGTGPRPQVHASGISQKPLPQQPPRTPAPPDADSQELYNIFQAANRSGTRSLTESEMGNALVNGDFTPFDSLTVKSLMRMFSTSPPGQPQGPTVTWSEFQNLWRFLAAWRELFERFDEDRTSRISLDEFSKALVAFGYRLSPSFVSLLYNTYNSRGLEQRRGSRNSGMSFDLFVQACISLKRITDVFKGYDDDRDGYITVSFEEFLTEILKLRD